MMVVIAGAVVASTFVARVGARVIAHARQDWAAEAVALALATGDRTLATEVAVANDVRIVDLDLTGDHDRGFDARVSVVLRGSSSLRSSTSRASTELDDAIPGSGGSVLR